MSRSFRSQRRDRVHLHGAHKRIRSAVQQVLRRPRPLDEAAAQVLADQLEERGKLAQAEALRKGEELVLPLAPAGFNSRLRW